MVPSVKDNNPYGTLKTVSKEWAREGRQGNNFTTDYFKLIVTAVTWLKYCRYGVKLYQINQSIGQQIRPRIKQKCGCPRISK